MLLLVSKYRQTESSLLHLTRGPNVFCQPTTKGDSPRSVSFKELIVNAVGRHFKVTAIHSGRHVQSKGSTILFTIYNFTRLIKSVSWDLTFDFRL